MNLKMANKALKKLANSIDEIPPSIVVQNKKTGEIVLVGEGGPMFSLMPAKRDKGAVSWYGHIPRTAEIEDQDEEIEEG